MKDSVRIQIARKQRRRKRAQNWLTIAVIVVLMLFVTTCTTNSKAYDFEQIMIDEEKSFWDVWLKYGTDFTWEKYIILVEDNNEGLKTTNIHRGQTILIPICGKGD